jgi:hypothetical protein
MDEAQFWKLIEEARQEADGECDTQAEILIQKLLAYKPEELIAFDDIMFDLRIKAYRGDLWGAAYLINGGCSDDGFEYFRCWLIGQGERSIMMRFVIRKRWRICRTFPMTPNVKISCTRWTAPTRN